MAISINRLLTDGPQTTTVEFVLTSEATAQTGTILAASDLVGSRGNNDERFRIKRLTSLISDADGAGAQMTLEWGGSGDVFCTLGVGQTDVNIPFEPTNNFDGDLNFSLTAESSATLRITLHKLHGYSDSQAQFNTSI
jgi:hypothetical protein